MLRVEYALTSDRTMKALTGLTRSAFRALIPAFDQALYEKALHRAQPRQRLPGGGGPATLKTAEAKLFFILMYVKCYPTFDVAGVLYGVHRSRAHRWTQDWLPVLEKTLGQKMVLPERQIHQVEAFFHRFPTAQTLFIDGSERPTQRPQDSTEQKNYYSGKKKRHTRKHLFIGDDQRRILALSPPAPGSHHDYTMFKDWHPPDRLPDGVIYWTDSGFQGLRTDYPQCPVIQPQKKPRGQKLNNLDQWCNALRARIRIVVEHAIGGVKRFGAVAQTYRNRGAQFEDRLTLVACGLWNWHLQQTD
jgi:hypothetical protein